MNTLNPFHEKLVFLPRVLKRLVMFLADFIMVSGALASAFWLTNENALQQISGSFLLLCLLSPLIAFPVFYRLGLYRAVVRYMGIEVLYSVVKGVSLSAIIVGCLNLAMIGNFNLKTIIVFWVLCIIYVGGSRLFIRSYFHWLMGNFSKKRSVAIYGAGTAGIQLAAAFKKGNEFSPVAFIDDNPGLWKSRIEGVEIFSPSTLPELIENKGIKDLLLALPSASPTQRKNILQKVEPLPVHVKSIPSMPELVSGRVRLDEIKDVEIEDILGRQSIDPDFELLEDGIKEKVIMVTGAGGSIGSELCRQIIRLQPHTLILYEVSELGLYMIEKELLEHINTKAFAVNLIPVLGCVTDKCRLGLTLKKFEVSTIYHAAAYKHVPMVEHNLTAGLANNVFGTHSAAITAEEAGVDTFVLISTDKAVRPTNFMGATKRFAELVLQALADKPEQKTRYCMVRFGNVLGSSGSVVPLFREQIIQGGPLTVTHPEVIRYFMTIPEAAQLVIQATSMGVGGDVFVLDMGEPVKILDLAQQMIHLMGYSIKDTDNPGGDIEITYTGLRPGEKLYEELLIGENAVGTDHPMIIRANEEKLTVDEIDAYCIIFEKACEEGNGALLIETLMQAVNGYEPESELVDELALRIKAEHASESNIQALFPSAD